MSQSKRAKYKLEAGWIEPPPMQEVDLSKVPVGGPVVIELEPRHIGSDDLLTALSSVAEAFEASDLSTVPLTERKKDEALLLAIHDPGGKIPALHDALLAWTEGFPTPRARWYELCLDLLDLYRIADAIAILTRQQQSGEYSAVRVTEARETIKNGMTFERTLFPNFIDEYTFRLDGKPKTHFDLGRSVIAETLTAYKGGIFRCIKCERLFARANPRAKYCGVNCRSSEHYHRKQAAS